MNIKLKKYTITIKDELSWGDNEKINLAKGTMEGNGEGIKKEDGAKSIQDPAMLPAMMRMIAKNNLESKYVSVECVIIEIKEGEEVIAFSREWLDSLSKKEGSKIIDAVEELKKK